MVRQPRALLPCQNCRRWILYSRIYHIFSLHPSVPLSLPKIAQSTSPMHADSRNGSLRTDLQNTRLLLTSGPRRLTTISRCSQEIHSTYIPYATKTRYPTRNTQKQKNERVAFSYDTPCATKATNDVAQKMASPWPRPSCLWPSHNTCRPKFF